MSERHFIVQGPLPTRLLFAIGTLAGAWVVERWEPLVALMMILFITSLFPTGDSKR